MSMSMNMRVYTRGRRGINGVLDRDTLTVSSSKNVYSWGGQYTQHSTMVEQYGGFYQFFVIFRRRASQSEL